MILLVLHDLLCRTYYYSNIFYVRIDQENTTLEPTNNRTRRMIALIL